MNKIKHKKAIKAIDFYAFKFHFSLSFEYFIKQVGGLSNFITQRAEKRHETLKEC